MVDKSLLNVTQWGLISGMVWGGSNQLPPQVYQDLQTTGLLHVVSASGFNVALVGSWVRLGLKRLHLPLWLNQLVIGATIWWYVGAAGGGPSLQRAATVSTIALVTAELGRPYLTAGALLITTVVWWLIDPMVARSVSFQLSVAASWGITQLLPVVWPDASDSWWWQSEELATQLRSTGASALLEKKAGLKTKTLGGLQSVLAILKEGWWVTLAAQAYTWPLIWQYFGQFQVSSLVANPLVIWLVPIITTLGALWYALETVPPIWAISTAAQGLVVILLWIVTSVFIASVRILAELLEFLVWQVPSPGWWSVLIWWIALELWRLQRLHARRVRLRRSLFQSIKPGGTTD